MKKIATIFASLLSIAVVVVFTQRSELATRLLPRAIELSLSNDKVKQLGEGLHILLCGAGGPMPAPTRSGPCIAVVAAGKLFLVDAGSNGIRNLGRMQYPLDDINGIFLTHFHSDHIDGLGEIATLRWVAGNHTAPLDVYGPEGVVDVVDGFNAAYEQDTRYRYDHHGSTIAPPTGSGMRAVSFVAPADTQLVTVFEEDGLTVQMLRVNHFPVDPAVGYLFRYRGRTALISGDTIKSDNLQYFAQNVDLLVHEALSKKLVAAMRQGALAAGNLPLARLFDDIPDYHTTPVEAAEIARDAGVGHLLFYHIVPPLILPGSEAAWLAGVEAVFADFTLGRDGLGISLPADSKDIIVLPSTL